ncbi:MAG: hypothetical protein A2Z88_04145 [Omnitrophica WOR_2 bacterium GWA2_47_8]|nr:MAG: hypothetical protein A2Z88_04145 [Omnitrophica WOR_2 bacterium GWA2_47_8]
MEVIDYKQLLQKDEVLEAINRHKWLESEKAGHDIGFEKAAEDWLNRFAAAWVNDYLPKQNPSKEFPHPPKNIKPQRRPAKSYF